MTIALRAVGVKANGTGAIVPALPVGHLTNDILVLFCQTSNQAITAPSGYTEFTGSPQGTGAAGGASACAIHAFWKRDGGSESAPTVADSGDHQIAQIYAFSGCLGTVTPVDTSGGDVASTSTTVTIPAITTTIDNDYVIVAVANEVGGTAADQLSVSFANAALTGLAALGNAQATSGNGGGFNVGGGKLAAHGSTGTTSATLAATSVQARFAIALILGVVDITSDGGAATATASVAENQTAVTTVVATTTAGGTVAYSISGGADAALFSIVSATGVLTFIGPPNFEVPTDANSDNAYVVAVTATDGTVTDVQTITVTVTDVTAEAIGKIGPGFGLSLGMGL